MDKLAIPSIILAAQYLLTMASIGPLILAALDATYILEDLPCN